MKKTVAKNITERIRYDLSQLEANLEEFIAENGWTVLGYPSFVEWWDAEIGRANLSGWIKQYAISVMILEEEHNGWTMGASKRIGERVGISDRTVQRLRGDNPVLGRQRPHFSEWGGSDNVMWAAPVPVDLHSRLLSHAKRMKITKADLVRAALSELATDRGLA